MSDALARIQDARLDTLRRYLSLGTSLDAQAETIRALVVNNSGGTTHGRV